MTPDKYLQGIVRTDGTAARPRVDRLLHAAVGVSTEAGELLDQMKRHVFYGMPLDESNLVEELGDLFWYAGLMVRLLGTSFEEVFEKNAAKLSKRYKDAFTVEECANRDTATEQRAMVGSVYHRSECPFVYCDDPDTCKRLGHCRHTRARVAPDPHQLPWWAGKDVVGYLRRLGWVLNAPGLGVEGMSKRTGNNWVVLPVERIIDPEQVGDAAELAARLDREAGAGG